ncbi:autotransporter outer membrane beta-barrel domain-containing protein [Zophobihabitans entericus]|uniref:Autotransporter outer membrane beta-barrel domain-containing protein n=1 Tax=Zophobihabitans entericus TaxID=1635327 RepID=A0A6G9IBY1_9GAMM|nr:autotransporter outer membrane beta-barrel domain-containing protein [Zophobihabitans entericus]QIQ21342.1 autotransporter outer membrane beta-barrel domain-containing protein [Zophobihabitans entericus]
MSIKNRPLLPILAIAGNMVFAPLALATEYNTPVDLNSTTLVSGDKVIVDDQRNAVSSTTAGSGALQLGNGSITVELTNSIPDVSITGVNLTNKMDNDFGIGSTIDVKQTTPPTTNTVYNINAVNLGDQTNMSGSGLDIEVTGSGSAKGIIGTGNNIVDLGDGSKIKVESTTSSAGVVLNSSGKLIANGITIEANSNSMSTGIESSGADVDLGTGSKIIIETNAVSDVSYGVKLSGNAELTADNLTIETTTGKGILAGGTSTVKLGSNSKITSNGDGIATLGTDVNVEADSLTIETSGSNGYGINMNNGAHSVDLGSNSKITTTGTTSTGVWMVGRNDATFTAEALTIHTIGSSANAIDVRRGSATISAGSVLQSDNAGTVAVYAASGSTASATINDSKLISGGSYAALSQGANSTVNLNNVEIEVDRNGSPAYALWATGGGGKINVNGMNLQGAAGVYGIVANNQGKVTLQGDITLNALSGVAMIADGTGGSITGTGKMNITGQLAAQNSALVDLSMTSGSVLNGAVTQSSGGVANLALNNSTWTFDNDSSINNLALSNNSKVNFQTATDGVLTVNNLSGNGIFSMRTDLLNNSGDLIQVTGTTAGSHRLTVANSGSDTTDGTETLTLVNTADGQGSFGLTSNVELGGYVYSLRQTGTDWELYSSDTTSSAADASASFLNVSYLMNYAETQTLLQRMGDLRQGSEQDNVWVRFFYGNFDSFSNHKLGSFDMDYHGFQLGADKSFTFSQGDLYTGAFVGLTNSSQDYASGDGSLKSKSIGVYATYIMNSGAYLDGILKYQHHKNKLNVTDTQGNAVYGNGSSDGFSASIEGGHRFNFGENRTGWYVEPQVQLSYSWQDSTTIDNSNGLKVELDSYDSLLSRVGVLIGYEVNKADRAPVNFYFKNSWLHEFTGETSYKLNGSKEEISFKGDAWVSGVGASVLVNKSHTFYLDMEKTMGNKFDQAHINIGYRFSF